MHQATRAPLPLRYTTCMHPRTREIRETVFSGSVASRGDENPMAHGCVTEEQECVECGARRLVNINGRHVEVGGWYDEHGDIDSRPVGEPQYLTLRRDPSVREEYSRAVKEAERERVRYCPTDVEPAWLTQERDEAWKRHAEKKSATAKA